MIKNCIICNSEYFTKPSQNAKYCSKKCQGLSKKKEIEDIIGEDLREYLTREYLCNMKTTRQISKNIFGVDTRASRINTWLKKLDIPVRQGGEAIKTQWINNDKRKLQASETMKRNSKIADRSYMSTSEYRLKQSISKKGEKNGMYGMTKDKHPQWNANRTHEQRIKERKTFEVSQWRKSVFKRDDYICQCCGYDKGNILVSHHLYSYDEYEALRTDISNGVTLCENCHKDFHSKCGYGSNTKEQFEEYLKTRR